MQVREASLDDRVSWDLFVDNECGSFYQYFDWKYVYESRGLQYIPLIITNSSAHIIGVLPIVREKHFLCSTLRSNITGKLEIGGLVLKKSLSETESDDALNCLLSYIDLNYGNKCSSIRIVETDISLDDEPNHIFINKGYRYCYDNATHLPGNFILELQQPFEENIWKNLWPRNLRQEINKAIRSGAVVIEDYEFKYAEEFVLMLNENCKRHGTEPPSRDEIMTRIKVFRDKTKLFVAMKDNQPIVSLCCHYTPSTCYLSRVGSWAKDTDDVNKLCYKAAIDNASNSNYRYVDFGYAYDSNLAFNKERYRANRIPVKLYEKVFSLPKYIIEVGPKLIQDVWHDKNYLIRYRKKIWGILTHR